MSDYSKSLGRGAALLVFALLFAGCSKGASVQSFNPQADTARSALEKALTTWQNGQAKPGLIEGANPPIQVDDSAWAAGKKLKSFEIVEAMPGDGPRKFSVKLTLEGAAAPEQTTFVVVGKSPLLVMRESDYNRDSGM